MTTVHPPVQVIVSCEEKCAICFEVFKDELPVMRMPTCDHTFHVQCILSWLTTSRENGCPLCRSQWPSAHSACGNSQYCRTRAMETKERAHYIEQMCQRTPELFPTTTKRLISQRHRTSERLKQLNKQQKELLKSEAYQHYNALRKQILKLNRQVSQSRTKLHQTQLKLSAAPFAMMVIAKEKNIAAPTNEHL